MQTAMADMASKAVNTVKETVQGVAKSVDPKKGEAAPMHGKTAVVTGAAESLRPFQSARCLDEVFTPLHR